MLINGAAVLSGTRVDKVSLTLRHSVILDDVILNLQHFNFKGNISNQLLCSTKAKIDLQSVLLFCCFMRRLYKVTCKVFFLLKKK